LTLHCQAVEAVHGIQLLIHADLLTLLTIIIPWLYSINPAYKPSSNHSVLAIMVLTSTRFVYGSRALPFTPTIVRQLISHKYRTYLRLNVQP